ncbi:putative tyrosine-protein kinase Wsck [Drosophila grimshawi]|uniref:GH19136 n=1 Tax=Drosophila grimshawi TaxID=7222 RepID=B4JEK2_DROGR|nr:putative tyrosine-protein kinase Wsck [Drosophila grimshawi]EDV93133.1 GH19136 [Drosophila grimshawi]
MPFGHRPIENSLVFFVVLLLLSSIGVSVQEVLEEEPVYFYVGCYTARTDLFKELVYAKMPQTCIEMCEHQGHRYAVLAAEKCFCANQLEPQQKQDENLCHTRCMANKAQYCGGVGVHSYYSTTLLRQPAPHHLRMVNSSENSISLAWDAYGSSKLLLAGAAEALAPQTQQIANFLIRCRVMQTYSTLPAFQQPEFIVQGTETRFELTDLQPATLYNISVRAICVQKQQQMGDEENECGHATIMASTEVGLPSPAPAQPKILTRTENTITVELAPVHNNNGPVTKLLVIVEFVDNALSQPFDAQLLGSWQDAQQNGVPYYIAAELDYDRPEDNRTRHFVVGDNKRYGRYRNVPLEQLSDEHNHQNQPDHVHISLGVESTLRNITKTLYTRSGHEQHASSLDDFSYATFEKGQSSVVALAVTCVIFGSCLLLSLITYFYLRYKTCHGRGLTGRGRNAHEMTQQTPIIERENNGYLVEEELPPTLESFKQQLQSTIDGFERLPRNALRLNANDVIGEGRYGEIITGRINNMDDGSTAATAAVRDSALHVLALDDLNGTTQAQLLRELRQLRKLQHHELLLDFYGISASADWFYLVFELQRVSLKRRLIESRQAAPALRLTVLTEQLVLQWMYELSSAMAYLGSCQVLHRQLTAYSVFVSADSKLKLSVFGPPHYVNSNRQQLDLCRWLAPEVLRHQHHTTKSDVWSFACVAWECCALGGTPYANVANGQQLLESIRAGVRPAQPAYVYGDLYQLLLNCWQLEPSERIGFEDVAFGVRQLMTSARHALCFDRSSSDTMETLPLYLPMLETSN